MKARLNVPFWALMLSIPLALLAVNCGPADLSLDQPEAAISAKAMDNNSPAINTTDDAIANTDQQDLKLDEGATDKYHRRGFFGWGRGFRYVPSYPYYYPYYGLGFGTYPFYRSYYSNIYY